MVHFLIGLFVMLVDYIYQYHMIGELPIVCMCANIDYNIFYFKQKT